MSSIPSWSDFMVPVLRVQSDGRVRALRELISDVSDLVGLTASQRAEVFESGQLRAANRIGWATSYLTRVGTMERPSKGRYVITDFGRKFLSEHPVKITEAQIRAVAKPGDEWWVSKPKSSADKDPANVSDDLDDSTELDPEEMISKGVELIHSDVKSQLIDRLIAQDPAFFERAVVQLLVEMGYGGTGEHAAATQYVNDGGIDGVIDQDILGLNKVYIQAKRFGRENSVGRPEVQAFVGALSGKAEQGVLITTGRISPGAREYAERDARARIILIDGARLVELMLKFRVGVQVKQAIEIVEIDEDFFE